MVEYKSLAEKYKIESADKYSLSMAINNAAVIMADNEKYNKEEMRKLIKELFSLYKEIRKEELGY